jgi:hypothetical protein
MFNDAKQEVEDWLDDEKGELPAEALAQLSRWADQLPRIIADQVNNLRSMPEFKKPLWKWSQAVYRIRCWNKAAGELVATNGTVSGI